MRINIHIIFFFAETNRNEIFLKLLADKTHDKHDELSLNFFCRVIITKFLLKIRVDRFLLGHSWNRTWLKRMYRTKSSVWIFIREQIFAEESSIKKELYSKFFVNNFLQIGAWGYVIRKTLTRRMNERMEEKKYC